MTDTRITTERLAELIADYEHAEATGANWKPDFSAVAAALRDYRAMRELEEKARERAVERLESLKAAVQRLEDIVRGKGPLGAERDGVAACR